MYKSIFYFENFVSEKIYLYHYFSTYKTCILVILVERVEKAAIFQILCYFLLLFWRLSFFTFVVFVAKASGRLSQGKKKDQKSLTGPVSSSMPSKHFVQSRRSRSVILILVCAFSTGQIVHIKCT